MAIPQNSIRSLSTSKNLETTLYQQGQYVEAAALQKETLDVLRQVLEAKYPNSLTPAIDLATMVCDPGQQKVGSVSMGSSSWGLSTVGFHRKRWDLKSHGGI